MHIYLYCSEWYHQQATVLHVLCDKGYVQGTSLCDSLYFSLKMVFRSYDISIGMVILRKGGNAKASLHYFALFYTLNNY